MQTAEKGLTDPIRVLLVEDEPLDADLQIRELRRAALLLEAKVVSTEPEYRSALDEFKPDVILCDFAFPDFDGLSALRIAKSEYPHIPFIFVSGTLSEERLVIAVQNGAVDYVLKSNPIRLSSAVLRALEQAEEKRQLREAQLRVQRLSAIRDVMSGINRAIVRCRDSHTLFEEACRITTEVGGFPLAAIIIRTDAASPLKVDALRGLPVKETLASWVTRVSEDPAHAEGTIAEALRNIAPAIVNDLSEVLSIGTRRQLWDAGVRSMGSFPLSVGGAAVGVMVIATTEINFFTEEEIALVSDIATNLSFALELIDEQKRVSRLSRIRDVLSAVNEAIVHISDRGELYKEVCRIAYEVAGYVDVFAVTVDEDRRDPRIVAIIGAWARDAAELEDKLRVNMALGQGIVSDATATLRPCVLNELVGPGSSMLHQNLWANGVRSVGSFPLIVDGRCIGAMTFDSAESGYFDDEEIALLTNLTSNLSFALDHIARQARLVRLSRIKEVLSAVNAAIVRLSDRTELYNEACRIAVETGGFFNVIVGELDLTSRRLQLHAALGYSGRSVLESTLQEALLDTARPPGIFETAIRTLRSSVKNKFAQPGSPRSYGTALFEGVRSAASFPIVIDGKAAGGMLFASDIEGYFDAEEIELLTNVTNNLAFGLNLLQKQQRVDYLSYFDALTHLPNRTLFYDRLGQDIAASKKAGKMLALAIMDISRFSVINNTLGEHVGDDALRKVAARMRESIDEGHIARVGGDKFAFYLPMIDDLHLVSEMMSEDGIRIFDAPFLIHDRSHHITARAGCAVFPHDGDQPENLFQNAEAALLSAKASGAIYRFYAPELNARLAKQLDLEARLQRALEEDQFVLFYQPKVDVSTRNVIGFEALIRWRDPERGLVSPGDFIPLLEQTGMIIPVGRWALGEAARQYEAWRKEGLHPPRIAVNLSAVQLRQDRLVDDVRSAIELFEDECGLDLEVTESMLMENFDSAIEKLNAIRVLGPQLSLDDFGTGYSSLSYIHKLPLNALKIDRSFIVGMLDDVSKTSIVSTIISLGQALKLKVIAEGVESEEEARLLLLLRCDQIQGYLFSRPVPHEEAANFLRR